MQYHNLRPSVSATTADSRQIRRLQVIQSQIAKELRSRFSYLTTREFDLSAIPAEARMVFQWRELAHNTPECRERQQG